MNGIGFALLVSLALAGGVAPLASAAVPARTPGPSLDEALNQPADILARRVLGPAGEVYREVQRPFLGGVPSLRWLQNLTFATAPRSAGFPGLCEASTIFVAFYPAPGTPLDAVDPPVFVHSLHSGRLYRIVGDLTPLPDIWNDDYGRALDEQCASAGPVLSQPDHRPGSLRFFSGSFNGSSDFWPVHAYFGGRALQVAMAASRSGRLADISCEEDRSEPEAHFCVDPRSLLANLPMTELTGFEIAPCSADAPHLCVTARFRRPSAELYGQRMLAVEIRTGAVRVDPPAAGVEVLAVRISGHTIVY